MTYVVLRCVTNGMCNEWEDTLYMVCSQNWQAPDYVSGGVIIRFQKWENWREQLRPI